MSPPPVSSTSDTGAERHTNDARSPRDGESPSRERSRRAVTQGIAAAGLTGAGFAAGTLLESRTKLSRKLRIVRRRKRARAIRQAIAKRLP